MTNSEILKLAETCGFVAQDRWSAGNDDVYYECHECELLKFARKIYEEGYDEGTDDAYERQFRIQNEVRD